jgi:hypothetical protein
METRREVFIALRTEAHAADEVGQAFEHPRARGPLPRCLARAMDAQRRFGQAIWFSVLLLVLAFALAAVLLELPGPTPVVVWEERPLKTLVSVP